MVFSTGLPITGSAPLAWEYLEHNDLPGSVPPPHTGEQWVGAQCS